MSASVATPLERQFSTIAGLDSMTSSSALGMTTVTLQFTLDRDLDAAAQDTQSAIATAQRRLPPGMPNPPTLRRVNPADQPIMYLSSTVRAAALRGGWYAETMMAQRISMITGVAQVISTARRNSPCAPMDPDRLPRAASV
jgi:HAE1 family hydrophobic/amphiphilic exporter-1